MGNFGSWRSNTHAHARERIFISRASFLFLVEICQGFLLFSGILEAFHAMLFGWMAGVHVIFRRKVIFALAGFRFVGAKRKVCLSVLQIYPFAFFFFFAFLFFFFFFG